MSEDIHPFAGSLPVFEGRMPSRLDARDRVIDDVLHSLEAAGVRFDPFFDRLFLDEALSNAVLHGNGEDPRKSVTVRAFCDKDRWGFEVTDEGRGFEWKPVLEGPLDQSKPSGRGLALIRSGGGDLHFLQGGRRVVIVRKA